MNAPSVCTNNFAKREYDVIEIRSKVRRLDANRYGCVRASVRPCVCVYLCVCLSHHVDVWSVETEICHGNEDEFTCCQQTSYFVVVTLCNQYKFEATNYT